MLVFKPTDIGRICAGVPEEGSRRYWKSRGKKLSRLAMGLDLDRGRNKCTACTARTCWYSGLRRVPP
eukprot:16297942-Heterocapsa_arctica.AAC.1